jgi:DNA-directed RNA polymerase specialized sigma24 family protein
MFRRPRPVIRVGSFGGGGLTNQYLDWRRGSWLRRVLLHADPPDAMPVLDDHAQAAADRDEVGCWLARLPRQQRAALVLRYYEGLPDVEIADVLGIDAVRRDALGAWLAAHPELVRDGQR